MSEANRGIPPSPPSLIRAAPKGDEKFTPPSPQGEGNERSEIGESHPLRHPEQAGPCAAPRRQPTIPLGVVQQGLGGREIWSLFDVSWAGDPNGLPSYLARVLEHCADWFSAHGASIFLHDELRGDFVLCAETGPDSRVPTGTRLKPGVGIAGASIELGRPLLVGDPTQDPLLAPKVSRKRADISSAMVVPLMTPEGWCIGVLNVSRSPGDPPFSESDLSVAQTLGRHLALAVANATLVDKMNQAMAETCAAHAKLQDVVDRLPAGILVIDPGGLIAHCNPEAEAFLATPAARTWDELLLDCPGEVGKALAKAWVQEGTGRARCVDPKQDRSWSVACSRMASGGLLVAIQETSEHDRAERELARVLRLAEIGQMTAAIAHEIRNPLTGIRSAAHLIQESPESAADMCPIIEQEVMRLNELCTDFLEFARPLELTLDAVDLGEVLDRVVKTHQPEFELARVGLTVQKRPDLPKIMGDARRLEQVVRNLLLNALQACLPGGRVHLSTTEGGFVIEDDGKGMDAQTIEKLFTPFFTTRSDGTGLGLSNARKIVDAHGGQIRVTSQPGRGARFEVLLGGRY